jgi:hypothetical protein
LKNQHLWWLVYRHNKDTIILVQPASTLMMARMNAALDGVVGDFKEGHQLDERTKKLVPKNMIGRMLNRNDAAILLGIMEE